MSSSPNYNISSQCCHLLLELLAWQKKQQLVNVRVTFISKPQGVVLFFSLIQILHHIWALTMNPVIKLLMLVLVYFGSHSTIVLTQRWQQVTSGTTWGSGSWLEEVGNEPQSQTVHSRDQVSPVGAIHRIRTYYACRVFCLSFMVLWSIFVHVKGL